jgi:hypothetical protein
MERKTVNISGPIITAVEPNISRANSPAPSFGIVSGSLYDSCLLKSA